MIKGIGTDIVQIKRIKKSMENPDFLTRNFTKSENEYFSSKNHNPHTIAACFAAKEALSKAFGTGIRGFSLTDIEVLHDPLGKPYYNLYNNAKEKLGGALVFLTLSHTNEYAVAFAVIEE